ncbi:MAG: ankyrin repeat domain-containing protein [Planctomycetota bacterium]|jgi:cytohesin
MKLSLPLKLGIGVVLLFAAITAACLLWTPVKVRHYTGKLKSDKPKERVAGVEGLLKMGWKGSEALANALGGGRNEAKFLSGNLEYRGAPIPGNADEQFPIHIAAENGYADSISLLVDGGADVNVKTGKTPSNHKHSLKIELRFEITPLLLAVMNSHISTARRLIGLGADVNAKHYYTPLGLAVENENLEMVRMLVQNGADIEAKCNIERILIAAIRKKNGDMIEFLIEKGANVNTTGSAGLSPLHIAIIRDMKGLIPILLDKGADVNAKAFMDITPLHCAISGNISGFLSTETDDLILHKNNLAKFGYKADRQADSFHFMSRHGNPISKCHLEWTAYRVLFEGYRLSGKKIEAKNADISVVEQLLDAGADPEALAFKWMTPLHLATLCNRTDIIEILLKKGVNMDSKTEFSGSPLHYAVERGNLEMVRFLLSSGANINCRKKMGIIGEKDKFAMWTPLDILLYPRNKLKREDIVSLLRAHGGKTGKELEAEKK